MVYKAYNRFDPAHYNRLRNKSIIEKTTESFDVVRKYLDSCGMFMPKPKYKIKLERSNK